MAQTAQTPQPAIPSRVPTTPAAPAQAPAAQRPAAAAPTAPAPDAAQPARPAAQSQLVNLNTASKKDLDKLDTRNNRLVEARI